MSIGKRIYDLARSNITDFRQAFSTDALRDILTQDDMPDTVEFDVDTIGTKAGKQARKVRDAAEEAWQRAYEQARQRAGVRGAPPMDSARERKRWYVALNLEPGADLKAVRRAYRKQLSQFHPDRFANDPEKFKAATEVTRQLTEAYNGLARYLGG